MKRRMTIKTLSVALTSLVEALLLVSPASAVIYWEENFDSYGEQTPLNVQPGPNGHVWNDRWTLWDDPEIGSLAATSTTGQNGTLGAGRWDLDPTNGGPPPSGGTANQGSEVDMGVKVTSGMLYVDYDLHIGAERGAGIGAPQWWLQDTDKKRSISHIPVINDNSGGAVLETQLGLDYDGTPILHQKRQTCMAAGKSTLTTWWLRSVTPAYRNPTGSRA